ncbi:hypothetical protein D1AOALGA4SA_7824 [Olavius algarvensis Delta 1 endosymbiont]|nr:hypothetical protein D1AOALGA4SA_7824 [Olavius algarvensis Delta 1 endosymbiont]
MSLRSVLLNRPFDKRLTTSRIHYSMFDVGRSMFDVHQFFFRSDRLSFSRRPRPSLVI